MVGRERDGDTSVNKYATYAIVNGKDEDYNVAQKSLASQVEIQMAQGWMPQGGIVFIGQVSENGVLLFVFCQAIIRVVG